VRPGLARRIGLIVIASGLVVACGGASRSGDLGSPNGPGADATIDVASEDHVASPPGDDASEVDANTTPGEDARDPTPTDAEVRDAAGDGAADATPVDSGGAGDGEGGSLDSSGLDAPSDASKDPFACGPSLMCDSKTQYCSHAASSTIIIVADSASAYSCEPLPACDAADICSCFVTSPVDTCTCTDDGGGITRTCMCRVCASP